MYKILKYDEKWKVKNNFLKTKKRIATNTNYINYNNL